MFKSTDASENSSLSVQGSEKMVTIQKRQGLNVGESSSIWAVGMLRLGGSQTTTLNVDQISLKPGDNYKKKSWTISLSGHHGTSTIGTRTFLSEHGFLIGRASVIGGTRGGVALIVVDPNENTFRTIFEAEDGAPGTRASVFGYKVHTAGIAYDFIAISYRRFDGSIRIERFLVTPNASLVRRFERMTPYEAPNGLGDGAVYSSFLFQNCQSENNCQPIFYGGWVDKVEGYHLTANIPPTPFTIQPNPITPQRQMRPNQNFVSTSHPPGGLFGSVNEKAYSMAGDPDEGWVYLAADEEPFGNNSFTAYDRTNQLVFRVGRESKIGPQGRDPSQPSRPLVTVFKRECFFDPAFANCDPRTTSHSRYFTDVGERLGPSSDLGNGCVAILGWARPGEPDANDLRPGIYTACVRDPNNLDKGLSVTKIAETKGATYMYNDFTGSMLVDKPNRILFDFSEKKLNGFKKANFYWAPKIGFANRITGLNFKYRCYSKSQAAQPPPFKDVTLAQLPEAMSPFVLPQCGGSQINQVEIEISRIPRQRFTRFDLFQVSVITDRN